MTLSEQDAYALRRAVSMMDVPTELKISALVEALLATLDWKHNPAHWSLLQQIVTHDPAVSAKILRVDPTSAMTTNDEAIDETFVPTLAKSAQLSDQLIAASTQVGHFHHDCLAWLSKRSPMTPRIFLESGPLWAVGLKVARHGAASCGSVSAKCSPISVAPTTYYHKSTGLNAITDMVRDIVPHLLLPATTSPEMLVAKLAGERPANYEKLLPFEQRNEDLAARFAGQRGIIIDEASKILIPKKYMEGHTETMMEMFDALTAWQIGWGSVSVASIGSASNSHINLRWHGKLISSPCILVCIDADEAGKKAASEIETLSRAVKRVQVPMGKDMNEFYLRAGQQIAGEWLKQMSRPVS